MWKILLILAAILYSLSPVDFLPDYILGWGWLDDIAVLVILWQVFVRLKQRMGNFQGNRTAENDRNFQSPPDGNKKTPPPKTPYEILGVAPDATWETIKLAHRKLAAQYHPDKVSHLGEEFRQLAEERFKQIQQAYQELARRKKQ